jgi:hypothetical protein
VGPQTPPRTGTIIKGQTEGREGGKGREGMKESEVKEGSEVK